MNIPRNNSLIKLNQKQRDEICNDLLERYEVPNSIKLGDTLKYLYYYDNVRVTGTGILISILKTGVGNKLLLLCDNKVLLKILYNNNVSITVVKVNNKKVRKAKLNHLVKF